MKLSSPLLEPKKVMKKKTKKPNRKRQKLNLTVSNESRQQAKELAEQQHRSVSNLFEHLLAIESRRSRAREARDDLPDDDDPPATTNENGHHSHAHQFLRAIQLLAASFFVFIWSKGTQVINSGHLHLHRQHPLYWQAPRS